MSDTIREAVETAKSILAKRCDYRPGRAVEKASCGTMGLPQDDWCDPCESAYRLDAALADLDAEVTLREGWAPMRDGAVFESGGGVIIFDTKAEADADWYCAPNYSSVYVRVTRLPDDSASDHDAQTKEAQAAVARGEYEDFGDTADAISYLKDYRPDDPRLITLNSERLELIRKAWKVSLTANEAERLEALTTIIRKAWPRITESDMDNIKAMLRDSDGEEGA